MRYPLIDGQGNFGSVDGDPPAAMRYTEARLAKITEDILADLEKETVDFIPNFDQTREEPVVLPSRIPNLLVNGASGIAVGMATNIPPHNLREIVDAAILLIDKPDTPLKEIMKIVPGPDFPTGAYIAGREGIEAAYKTGRGSFIMRAKAAIEEAAKDRENIVITEIPYQVNKSRLIERIAELVQTKKLEGIADVRDESSREGMRIVIEIKRGEESQLILNNLFKLTQMQESFGMILLAIVAGQPRELGLIPLIKLFLEHRVEVVRRRTDLRAAQSPRARTHFGRLPDRARPSRRRHPHHSRFRQPRRSPRKPAQVFHRAGRHHHRKRQVPQTFRRQARWPQIQARPARRRDSRRPRPLSASLPCRSTPSSNCSSIA